MVNIVATFREHMSVIEQLDNVAPQIERIAERIVKCLRNQGKVLWIGNGGSAADCQHLAAEFVGRFTRERKGLPSIALTVDTSILTAVANDYGYERVFQRQVEALCRPGDVVVGISTSGRSPNVLLALHEAKGLGAYVVGFTGAESSAIGEIADECICVPSRVTARVQEAHILIGHILCDWVEEHHNGGDWRD